MDFTSVGSVNNYIKNLNLQNKWQQKKATGDFSTDEEKSYEARWLKEQLEQSKDSQSITAIYSKLLSGKKLTAEEKQYLQQKDPQAYQQAQQNESEQQRYEQELKRCKTKEDVQRLKMHHTAASLSTVNSVMNNPNIPEEKKLSIVLGEQQKMSVMQNTMVRFIKAGKYAKLPADAERMEAEKILHEAEEQAQKPAENKTQKPAEGNSTAPDSAESPEKTEPAADPALKDAAGKKPDSAAAAAAKAGLSPEVRKVKRARSSYLAHERSVQDIAVPLKVSIDKTV